MKLDIQFPILGKLNFNMLQKDSSRLLYLVQYTLQVFFLNPP